MYFKWQGKELAHFFPALAVVFSHHNKEKYDIKHLHIAIPKFMKALMTN